MLLWESGAKVWKEEVSLDGLWVASVCPAPIHLQLGSEREPALLVRRGALKVRRGTWDKDAYREKWGKGSSGWFWKQKNNLFLKQPDWFALEGFCV